MIGALNYFVLTFFVTFMNVTYFSIEGMYINRTFHNFPLALIEYSVILIDNQGIFDPYYDKNKVKQNVVTYLTNNLASRLNEYEISFTYYTYEGEEVKLDTSAKPKNIDIHFRCTYYGAMKYEGYRNFEIRGVKVYEWKIIRIYRNKFFKRTVK